MLKIRLIPVLLLQNTGLVKTVRFSNPVYVGDPINAVRIFNAKEVDEIILLDISSSPSTKLPIALISQIAEECFMPLTFGGGVRSIDDIRALLNAGVEKVSLNTMACRQPELVKQASDIFGSQSIVVSIDCKKQAQAVYEVMMENGRVPTGKTPKEWAVELEDLGAGEIFLNSIDQDGTMSGYDLDLIKQVADHVNIPLIACGGAGKMEDFFSAVDDGHASAVAAGSFFVFHGRRRAVLINFPTKKEITDLFLRNSETR